MSSDRIDTIDHKANAQDDWTVRAVGLATTLLILLPAPVGAQAGPATDEIALSELSVTGTGPAVERAGGPVIGYRATRSATATRTDTALRDTPQAVQVVPRDVLVDQQDIRLSDALQNVSSVQPGGTIQGRSDTFIIRGFRTQTYAIDGVLLNQAGNFSAVTRDLADVERIEVLKGPASVLYGRGDPGGLINIVTRQPTRAPSGDINLQAGSFGFRRVQGSVSGAIEGVEGLAARLSFAGQSDPTFRNFGGRDNSRTFVAPAFAWTPAPDTRVTFLGEFTRVDNQYDEGLVARNGRVPLDNVARYYGAPFSRYNGDASFGLLKVEHDLNANITLREVLNAQWGGFNALASRATGLTDGNTTVTRRETGVYSTYASVDSQTEIVAKFDLLGFRHTVLAGVEYTNGYRRAYTTQSATYPSVNFLAPLPGPTIVGLQFQSDLKQKNALAGLYAQDQIDLGLGLQLLVGVRYDTGTQYYFSRVPTSRTIPPDQELSGTSPRVGLIYRPAEPLTLYASYATSFKPQTDNVYNAGNPRPETGELYEIGSRLDLNPDLTLSTAAFRIIRNNVAAADPVNTGFSVITGQQRSEGVEADLAGQVLPGWKVIGGISVLDARITRDTTFAVGNRLVGAPAFSGSIWSTYQFQEGVLLGWTVGAGITYVGRRAGDLNSSYAVGGYARLDAAVFYDFGEHARFSINARNLTDRRYIEQPFNPFNNLPGAPLSVLATITARL
ncbi:MULTISPECIES: TonB-dependent siderophore receptor [Methylobacterium]|uniref:TonB-dependent siderophore receptor n=1 Tax=Methylobacterium longum TaxID=767694 RepID=A0ABT8AZC0_9HYPH|nr:MULTISPECIES: TonB-dependent siderophore receptor [Methylobacterium]MCJ2102538.1 TonB-dependent siderophore receptor [Methylobacterium sp. E-046]MDN3574604.1 TonB-dependent siderophore receptor [Methylobacterium longum]GJE10384.1 Metal-pseudopaline receptor CntO [Methylobacterium longum]